MNKGMEEKETNKTKRFPSKYNVFLLLGNPNIPQYLFHFCMVPMKIDMDETYLEQDAATCHTSNASMREIESYFCDRLISRNLWPPRSADLTPPDFFLWGLLKGRVYSNKTRYGGRLLPLPMSNYQTSSPICRLAYRSAWMLQGAIFSI
jgi:hypothetical protein